MKRSLLSLAVRLLKIYFSDIKNKEQQYKKTIFYTLKDMGGIYIKFLQALSITQHFTDGWGGPKEFEIFNKVKVEPITLSDYVQYDKFISLEEKPFASGSFAQLYKGKLKTGETVAIKILRPSIQKNLKKDLRKLKKIVKIASHFLPKTIIDYKAAFDEFSNCCLLETDYEREVSNMLYFKKFYQQHPYVVIPKVYSEFCYENVIIQEFIEGPTLADILANIPFDETLESVVYKNTGSDIWKQVVIAGGELLCNAITSDYVFGDPHPGNIILLPNDKIAFIDFGIIAPKPTSQEAFYLWVKSYHEILKGNLDYGQLLKATCMCFCPDLVNALQRCNIKYDFFGAMAEAINQKVQVVKKQSEVAACTAEDGHLFTAFIQFIDNKNVLNIQLDTYNFQLLKAIQIFLNSVTTIDNGHGNHQFSSIMIESIHYALTYCERHGVKQDMSLNTKYSVNESYELLLEMFSSLAADEFLFETISEKVF